MIKAEFEIAYKWLADAPLFIDSVQVDRFHDAVVVPLDRIVSSTVEVGKEKGRRTRAEATAEAKATILSLFKGKLAGQVGGELQSAASKNTSIVFQSIHTPQRQLVQLAWHYEQKCRDRAFYVSDPRKTDWRSQNAIAEVPRLLVFLDLPSETGAKESESPSLKLIPTAAEFENGSTVQLFNRLRGKEGRRPPKYPPGSSTDETVRNARKAYWAWFDANFNARAAMVMLEKVAAENGRIRWMDFRLPITNEGDTLHLHLVPAGQYDTGVFAYNHVKRGFKHGLRLVGTLKSGPDMNVLGVYEK